MRRGVAAQGLAAARQPDDLAARSGSGDLYVGPGAWGNTGGDGLGGIHLFQFCLRAAHYGSFDLCVDSPNITLAELQLRKGMRFLYGTTSEQAYDPSPNLYDYAQTKAATMNYVKSLAKQLGPKGIRVNGVAPGPIYTPLQISGGATEEKWRNFGGNYPLARAGQPLSSQAFTSSLHPGMLPTLPATSTVPVGEWGNRRPRISEERMPSGAFRDLSKHIGTRATSRSLKPSNDNYVSRTARKSLRSFMQTNRIRVAVLATMTTCCASGILQAQDAASSATADKTFLTMADESNSAEIAASQMALKKSKNPEIKSFAQQMITDHEKLRADTASLAQQMGVMTPQPLNDTHKAEGKRLSALSGKSFDMEYIKTMDLDHHKALDMFKNEIAATSNPDLKAAISQGEPVIQQHTDMADQMAQKMNVQSGTSGGR